jgi:putative oxidoreductase
MKIVVLIARIVLGVILVVFGFNHIVPFIPAPPPSANAAGQFMSALTSTRYMIIVGMLEVIPGLLLIANRYVPLALTLLGPIVVNILLVGFLMDARALGTGAVVTILWVVVYWRHRSAFRGIFQRQVEG